MNKFSFLLIVLFSYSVHAQTLNQNDLFYYGTQSGEVTLQFATMVEVQSGAEPTKFQVNLAIKNQLQHLFGSMAANTNKAVPKGDEQIEVLRFEQKDQNSYRVFFKYQGTVLMDSAVIGTYAFYLPINPETIYQRALVGRKNPCTDAHYQGEGDFWYFWNPEQPGCPLKLDVDYQKITGFIQRIENTKQSTPEYSRLVDSSGTLKVSMFFGMDNPNKKKDPNFSDDINAKNYRDVKRALLLNGYKAEKLTTQDIENLAPGKIHQPRVTIENFKKVFSNQGVNTEIFIQMFFGSTGINESNHEFHQIYKLALEHSAVLIYDGHSGLGGHLDVNAIEESLQEKIKFDPLKYQIYFFNSCSSYSYYNKSYFERKKSETDPEGFQNLDILTNGLSTYFYVLEQTNLAFIQALEVWAATGQKISYQELAQQIDSENLFGVNGDDDNP